MNSQTFRTIRNLAFVVCAFACTSILSPGLRAQSTFGSIRGATQDQTGAALPEVIVKLHNEDENTDVSTLSDSSGNFVFQNVKPGHYRLQGAKEGFSLAVVDKVELAARQDIRLDLRFALAATSLQVEVTGPAVWRFVAENWDEVTTRIASNHHARLAYSVYFFIKDPGFAAGVEAFHVEHSVPGGYPANVTQSLERLRVGLAFADVIRQQF